MKKLKQTDLRKSRATVMLTGKQLKALQKAADNDCRTVSDYLYALLAREGVING